MKKKSVLRKVLAVSLSVAMLLGTGFTTVGQFIGTGGISVSAADTVSNGQCGADVHYTLDSDGILNIYGTGDMWDYDHYKNFSPFYNNPTIREVVIREGVTSVGTDALMGCVNLTSVTISNNVISICDRAFDGCTDLKNVTIGNGVTSIGNAAFYRCNLTNVTIPNSVITIGISAFEGCGNLINITIPDSVMTIGEAAFAATSLTSITIPNSMTTIGAYAFEGCKYFTIYGRKSSYAETYAGENGFAFVSLGELPANEPLENNSVISAEKITFGDSVNITCAANGGTGNYQYEILYKTPDDSDWETFQNYSANTAVTFNPAQADIYDIRVNVKDGNGTVTPKTFSLEVEKNELENISAISAAEITLDDSVKITAATKGGAGEYQYQVLYKMNSASSWTMLQRYSENTVVSFTPATVGTYTIRVNVTDNEGTIATKDFSLKVNEKEEPVLPLENTSTLSKTNIDLGETIDIFASATGGKAPYIYQIVYKQRTQTKWSTIQSYNANTKASLKPAYAVIYDVCVKVKDSTNTEIKKFFEITVTDNRPKNISYISASSIEYGETVTVNAAASGSTGFYQYAVYYKKAADTKWTTKQGFKANSIVTIKPSKATTYDICVKIKDNKGTVVKKYFTLEVTEKANKLSNISALSDTEIALGEKITVSASANGSTGFYQYAVSYKNTNDTDWTTVQDYSANSIVSVKPTIVGSYSICVSVKDDFNNKADKYFIVTVN